MTKKERKKAIKMGCKPINKGRSISSVHLNLQIENGGKHNDELGNTPGNGYQSIKKKKQSRKENLGLTEDGVSYHFDIWFHIGRFVVPESVRTFSLICHGCWNVTLTAQFWLSLYQRHVRSYEKLPSRLKPLDIDAGSGIRARVIRALFYVYLPLSTLQRDFTGSIIDRRCSVFWWEKEFNLKKSCFVWNYLFKFVDVSLNRKISQHYLLENSEKDNIVMKVKCPNYIHLDCKSCSNMVLTSFHDCMSSDMRYHKLKMVFNEERRDKKYVKEQGKLLIITPVIEYSIIPWWNPSYPHSVR